MYDLTRFAQEDLDRCGAALRELGAGASSMEEVANRVTRHLFENAINPGNSQNACALVRFYKTHPYEDLNQELRGFAQEILGHPPESPDMKCLVLLATAGEKLSGTRGRHPPGTKPSLYPMRPLSPRFR